MPVAVDESSPSGIVDGFWGGLVKMSEIKVDSFELIDVHLVRHQVEDAPVFELVLLNEPILAFQALGDQMLRAPLPSSGPEVTMVWAQAKQIFPVPLPQPML